MSKDYLLEIGKLAIKDLKRLPLKEFKQVMVKALKLQTNPQPQDCRSLKGYPGGYRVDRAKYWLLYTIERDTVRVFRVGKGWRSCENTAVSTLLLLSTSLHNS